MPDKDYNFLSMLQRKLGFDPTGSIGPAGRTTAWSTLEDMEKAVRESVVQGDAGDYSGRGKSLTDIEKMKKDLAGYYREAHGLTPDKAKEAVEIIHQSFLEKYTGDWKLFKKGAEIAGEAIGIGKHAGRFIPGVAGTVLSLYAAKEAAAAGKPVEAAVAGVGAVPVVGDAIEAGVEFIVKPINDYLKRHGMGTDALDPSIVTTVAGTGADDDRMKELAKKAMESPAPKPDGDEVKAPPPVATGQQPVVTAQR